MCTTFIPYDGEEDEENEKKEKIMVIVNLRLL